VTLLTLFVVAFIAMSVANRLHQLLIPFTGHFVILLSTFVVVTLLFSLFTGNFVILFAAFMMDFVTLLTLFVVASIVMSVANRLRQLFTTLFVPCRLRPLLTALAGHLVILLSSFVVVDFRLR